MNFVADNYVLRWDENEKAYCVFTDAACGV